MFTARKVAQMAAVFARHQGGNINVLKLMKLLYLADREAMRRYGLPISFDSIVGMPHGPVLSQTLNLVNGSANPKQAALWEEWMSDRDNHDLCVRRNFERNDLDELSDSDIDVLDTVWAQFGKMDKWAIRDYTHDHCPEWKDPQGSVLQISDEAVLLAVGKDPAEAESLARDIQAQRDLDSVFAKL